MFILGITGGIGSGKSEVLSYLEKAWKARILRSDDLSRDLLDPGTEGYQKAVSIFGDEIVEKDGTLDRKKIAARIFQEETLREQLDAYIHPAVVQETKRQIDLAETAGEKLFVIESALIFERSYNEICDQVWYIYADEETRAGRLYTSRGYDMERITRTMRRQLPDAAYRKKADIVIDNGGDFADTRREIDRRLEELRAEGRLEALRADGR